MLPNLVLGNRKPLHSASQKCQDTRLDVTDHVEHQSLPASLPPSICTGAQAWGSRPLGMLSCLSQACLLLSQTQILD